MARRCALALSVALACAPAWAGPPLEPSVATMEAIGQPGGDLQMLAASSQDTRLLVVYGYARLVGYDRDLNLVPDILSAVEVEDGRVFTLRLREGHRWSDGAPFTTEDFRYYWEDVANNEKLSPFGPPRELLVDGELPTGRDPGSAHGPLQLVLAEPLLPAGAGRRPTAVHLPARALSEPVPREVRRSPEAASSGGRGPGARLGAAARPARSHVPVRQSGSADAAAVDAPDQAAGRALHRRAQPLLPPGRRRAGSSCPTSTA